MDGEPGLIELLTETVLSVEWSTIDRICPQCWAPIIRGHYEHCRLDAALTRLGLGTRAARDEYRHRLHNGRQHGSHAS